MKRKDQKIFMRKQNRKRGFTIAELSVVLALLAILTTMITSLTILVSNFSVEHRAKYDFFQDCHEVKTAVTQWASENDVEGNEFSIKDGVLTLTQNSEPAKTVTLALDDTTFTIGETRVDGISAVSSFSFDAQEGGKLVKCTLRFVGNKGQLIESSFVFCLRLASISEEVTQGE